MTKYENVEKEVDLCYERIKKRNRTEELKIEKSYLYNVALNHYTFFYNKFDLNVTKIDTFDINCLDLNVLNLHKLYNEFFQ